MKTYDVEINGVSHRMAIEHEDLKRYPGAKEVKVSRRQPTDPTPTPTPPAPKPEPDAEPAGNASREAWAEFAEKVKSAKPEDLVDADGKELGRDELKEKFGTPPA